jgi:tetratricopeptide (TPR) repeat protein
MSRKFKNNRKAAPADNALAAQVRPKLDEAVALHQQGRLQEAVTLYSDILKIQPQHFDAIHLLGVIADQFKNHQLAADLIAQAILINPNHADLHELKRFDEALASYDAAIAIRPDYAEAHCNRGNVLKDLNRFDDAIAGYDRSLTLAPDDAETYSNRGLALQQLKRLDESLACFERAVALRPDDPKAHWNKGLALLLRGDYANGWPLYELRWHEANATSKPLATSRPRWTGGREEEGLGVG